jgi:hypothetical protein
LREIKNKKIKDLDGETFSARRRFFDRPWQFCDKGEQFEVNGSFTVLILPERIYAGIADFHPFEGLAMDTVSRFSAGFSMSDNTVAKLMTITTRRSPSGMFFATSEDEPTFFVATTSVAAMNDAVRMALEDLFNSRDHTDVTPVPTDRGSAEDKLWAIIPKEALAVHADC